MGWQYESSSVPTVLYQRERALRLGGNRREGTLSWPRPLLIARVLCSTKPCVDDGSVFIELDPGGDPSGDSVEVLYSGHRVRGVGPRGEMEGRVAVVSWG